MDPRTPHGSITRQCTATSKRSGERCRKPAMHGRTVCLAHGGASPRGAEHPSFRHGRYSDSLPTNLRERYEASLADPRQLDLTDEIAICDTMISEILRELDTDAAIGQVRRLEATMRQLERLLAAGNFAAMEPVMAMLRDQLAETAAAERLFRLDRLLTHRRLLTEANVRIRLRAETALSADEAMALFGAIADVVVRLVPDPVMRQAIADEWTAIMGDLRAL